MAMPVGLSRLSMLATSVTWCYSLENVMTHGSQQTSKFLPEGQQRQTTVSQSQFNDGVICTAPERECQTTVCQVWWLSTLSYRGWFILTPYLTSVWFHSPYTISKQVSMTTVVCSKSQLGWLKLICHTVSFLYNTVHSRPTLIYSSKRTFWVVLTAVFGDLTQVSISLSCVLVSKRQIVHHIFNSCCKIMSISIHNVIQSVCLNSHDLIFSVNYSQSLTL